MIELYFKASPPPVVGAMRHTENRRAPLRVRT